MKLKFKNRFKKALFWFHVFRRQTILRLLFTYLIFLFAVAALLMLPYHWVNQNKAFNFLDSLYLTVSGFSTTGLTVVDIASELTFMGQFLIFVLIIIGGIGLLFFKVSLFYFTSYLLFGKRWNTTFVDQEEHFERGYILKQKTQKMLKIGFIYLFSFEVLFALIIFFYFYFSVPNTPALQHLNYYHNFGNSLWSATFHVVSAANNAGFDIFNEGFKTGSLMVFRQDYFVQMVFMILFVIGGIGFPFFMELHDKISNLRQKKPVHHRFSFFVKFSVISYAIIAVVGISINLIFEAVFNDLFLETNTNNFDHFMAVFFNTFSTRSAGFSTVDINSTFSAPTKIVMTCLMFIGSAPLSTGGGFKVTTFVILLYGVFGRYDCQNNLLIRQRAVNHTLVRRAFVAFFIILSFLTLFAIIGSAEHTKNPSNIQIEAIMFDGVSAFGNVGLSSINIIDKNWDFYKISTIILMLIGQFGIGNFQFLLQNKRISEHERLPEKIVL